MSRGSFRIEIANGKLFGIWGTGDSFCIGSPAPIRNKVSKVRLNKAKRHLIECYETFHKMSYEVAIENLREELETC